LGRQFYENRGEETILSSVVFTFCSYLKNPYISINVDL